MLFANQLHQFLIAWVAWVANGIGLACKLRNLFKTCARKIPHTKKNIELCDARLNGKHYSGIPSNHIDWFKTGEDGIEILKKQTSRDNRRVAQIQLDIEIAGRLHIHRHASDWVGRPRRRRDGRASRHGGGRRNVGRAQTSASITNLWRFIKIKGSRVYVCACMYVQVAQQNERLCFIKIKGKKQN